MNRATVGNDMCKKPTYFQALSFFELKYKNNDRKMILPLTEVIAWSWKIEFFKEFWIAENNKLPPMVEDF
ncbi:MAG TPA: hypothetical protein VK211_09755 [Kamptonema sp.]|nr:hypothetical protein [Kamptonema sp.]